MEHASYEIGTQHNEAGEPLVLVDGKVFGTVAQVKALIGRFEASADPIQTAEPAILCGLGLFKMPARRVVSL